MNSLQRSGGIAALIAAATYIVGMVLLFTALAPSGYGMDDADPARIVAFLMANQALMYSWNLIIYVVNAICLVVLSLALFERLPAPITIVTSAEDGIRGSLLMPRLSNPPIGQDLHRGLTSTLVPRNEPAFEVVETQVIVFHQHRDGISW